MRHANRHRQKRLFTKEEVDTAQTQDGEVAVHLSPEDEAELLEAAAEADRGETISPKVLFARIDRID